MSEKIASEAISRRSMLSFLGLAASSLTILSSVLRPSDAEAYTYGMARRQTRRVARRTGRYTRRAVRDTTEFGSPRGVRGRSPWLDLSYKPEKGRPMRAAFCFVLETFIFARRYCSVR